MQMQRSKKCSTSSTSPASQFLQICSFLYILNPHHLLVSILNSVVPPLNFTYSIVFYLLQPIATHLFLRSQSINLPNTSNFVHPLASSLKHSLTLLHAISFNTYPISLAVCSSQIVGRPKWVQPPYSHENPCFSHLNIFNQPKLPHASPSYGTWLNQQCCLQKA